MMFSFIVNLTSSYNEDCPRCVDNEVSKEPICLIKVSFLSTAELKGGVADDSLDGFNDIPAKGSIRVLLSSFLSADIKCTDTDDHMGCFSDKLDDKSEWLYIATSLKAELKFRETGDCMAIVDDELARKSLWLGVTFSFIAKVTFACLKDCISSLEDEIPKESLDAVMTSTCEIRPGDTDVAMVCSVDDLVQEGRSEAKTSSFESELSSSDTGEGIGCFTEEKFEESR